MQNRICYGTGEENRNPAWKERILRGIICYSKSRIRCPEWMVLKSSVCLVHQMVWKWWIQIYWYPKKKKDKKEIEKKEETNRFLWKKCKLTIMNVSIIICLFPILAQIKLCFWFLILLKVLHMIKQVQITLMKMMIPLIFCCTTFRSNYILKKNKMHLPNICSCWANCPPQVWRQPSPRCIFISFNMHSVKLRSGFI